MGKRTNVFTSATGNITNSFISKVTGPFKIVLDTPPPRVLPPLKMKVEYGQRVPESGLGVLKVEIG